ncbi:hypothetical protein C474_18399 [Halogeometricum pallidum JCM 14848]|uniref:DUF7344 domain-containing protein n=1 Tax=Halogeometricum pallidum JCM 14848 TaxID=1227487 RepID=M0CZM0_HALPD|nr:hypothetical protein [Halogeometricum pallidum]ELZ27344.1 hypothetical protein C474_18399 [Halogeometricum pallidum JCM 14848]
MYGILRHPFRRAVVAAGDALRAPMSLSGTADAVMDALASAPGPGAPGAPRAVPNLELQLHHTHLPKLDAAGVIAYDADEQTVVDVDEAAVVRLSGVSETLAAECADALSD